jgi:hypothetical protein
VTRRDTSIESGFPVAVLIGERQNFGRRLIDLAWRPSVAPDGEPGVEGGHPPWSLNGRGLPRHLDFGFECQHAAPQTAQSVSDHAPRPRRIARILPAANQREEASVVSRAHRAIVARRSDTVSQHDRADGDYIAVP